ncbi:GMC oxidoreductase [Colletotrichum navitas]|uniref:GMC oxidoreductase n=1 Tax=Colletotrichum navitas TaxID=681940 RepID=A0AAD8PKZ1_9PEZI|nr:GMC oxidoreductase [Colletotrichum navitas]KAK1566125.1 GMC oxidoreductase [Colletotrichum navitas]
MQAIILAATGLAQLAYGHPAQSFSLLRDDVADTYDYVVVGAGAGGMTVANRLSEDSTKTVLVIEAGPLHHYEAGFMIPRFYNGEKGTKYDWNHTTVAQTNLKGQSMVYTQGHVVGGGTSMNGMVFDRGTPQDYDNWAALGNPGWDFETLLPYFKKSETFNPPPQDKVIDFGVTYDPECHGTSGPVQSSFLEWAYPQYTDFFEGMASLGVQHPLDQGCGKSMGAYLTTHSLNAANQSRCDSRIAYYDSAVNRPNLHLLAEHQVTRLISEKQGDKVTIAGVEFATSPDDVKQTVHVKQEVIVSAGALHSPHILLLSGIGPAKLLQQHGIDVVVDLPGVGQNLQDHAGGVTSWTKFLTASDLTNNATLDAEQGRLYYANRTGRWTEGIPNAMAFIPFLNFSSTEDLGHKIVSQMEPAQSALYLPDDTDATVRAGYLDQVAVIKAAHENRTTAGMELIYLSGGTNIVNVLLHPLSRGSIQLNSTDPFVAPVIDPNFLAHPADALALIQMVRYNRRLMATDAMAKLEAVETLPGLDYDTDDEILDNTKSVLQPFLHPGGSCALLPLEKGGVVDTELRVYGVSNLRIADASVIPLLISAHTQATVYAIGERVGSKLKE